MNPAVRKSWHRDGCKGFALIEVLVCLAILSGGLLALLNFYSTFQGLISETRIVLQATSLAGGKLHQLESYLGTSDTRLIDGIHSDRPGSTLSDFQRTWTVTTDAKTDRRKHLTVSVAWTDRSGRIRTILMGAPLFVRPSTESLSTILEVIEWHNKTAGTNAWGIP